MRFVDLSAPITPSPAELPEPLRTDVVYSDHAEGAAQIAALFGVGPELLRDGEGWATDTFTRLGTHNSTHVDAPWHYNSTIGGERAQTIDELPLDWFFRPGVVLDFSDRADGDPVDVADVAPALQAAGHDLRERDIVLVKTGRDAHLDAPDYMIRGPGVTAAATHWLFDRVARREVSLGLAGEVDLPDGVFAEPFLDDEVIGIAASGQLKLRRGRASLTALQDQTLLVREHGSSTRAVAERYLARVGYHPAKRWELDSNEAIKRSVRAGLGIGFVSRLVVEEELERGDLVSFQVEGAEPMRRSVYLLRPDGRDPSPSERAFIETLCSCCSVSVAGCTA